MLAAVPQAANPSPTTATTAIPNHARFRYAGDNNTLTMQTSPPIIGSADANPDVPALRCRGAPPRYAAADGFGQLPAASRLPLAGGGYSPYGRLRGMSTAFSGMR